MLKIFLHFVFGKSGFSHFSLMNRPFNSAGSEANRVFNNADIGF